jgi:chromosome segregation ATPase
MLFANAIEQRLTVDKVSLEAAVNSANLNFSEASRKLDAVVAEIGELQGQMRTLREQLEHSQKSQAGVQVRRAMLLLCIGVLLLLLLFARIL